MHETPIPDECRLGLLVVFSDDMERSAEFYKAIGLRSSAIRIRRAASITQRLAIECVFEIYRRPDGREKSPADDVRFSRAFGRSSRGGRGWPRGDSETKASDSTIGAGLQRSSIRMAILYC